ncbi:hypothetical protein Q7P37_003234 [Cladosporium fusiforme]
MSSANTPSTSAPLQLFPSPSSYMPRKSSLKPPRSATSSPAPALKGVALQVTTALPTSHKNEPAQPSASSASPATSILNPANRGLPKNRLHARKRSSAPSLSDSPAVSEPLIHDDQLCPLPINTSFTQSSPPRIRTPVSRLKRPSIPTSISTQVGPVNDVASPIDGDQLSPLPTKLSFKPTAPPKQEYPSPVSFRSDASTLVRSNSDATGRSPASATSNPTRSMFPQYDHTKPLSQQHYFPQVSTSAGPLVPAQSSSVASASPQPPPKRNDSAVALPNGYEEIPKATAEDMLTIWHASTTTCPPTGRKVQLDIQQPACHGMSLTLGANGTALYTMQTSSPNPLAQPKEETKELSIHKTCPESALPIPISQLSLPPSTSKPSATSPPTTLFPHQAALDAIQTATNTPLASAIAASDPTGTSPAAARLAQNAVSQAHRQHTCTIRRANRHRDALGAVTAQYTLAHASLGNLAITVSPATANSTHDPKAKISLHHPRATPAALASQTLALLTLDFASQACVLDTPGLLALDEPYMLDVAVSAVLAVAFLENELLVQELVQFAPPPTAPVVEGAGGKEAKVKGAEKRKAKRLERKKRDREAGKENGLVRETVSLVGLGFKGARWLLRTARDSARGPPGT